LIEDGDTLTSLPVKIGVEALQPGPGTPPELASLVATELRAALDSFPQFQIAPDPQLTATGRVSGPRGRRSIEVQVIDKSGTVIQNVNVPTSSCRATLYEAHHRGLLREIPLCCRGTGTG